MYNNLKKGLAGVLAVSITAAALAGCSKKEGFDPSAALLSLKDAGTIDAATANLYLRYEQAQFENGMGTFIKSYYGDINLWEEDLYGSGETYGNTFKTQIMSDLEKMLYAEEHASEYSVEVTQEQKKAIGEAAKQFLAENDKEVLEKMSADSASVERMLTLYTLRVGVENSIASTVDTEVSDEEAAQRTVRYVQFTAQTEAAEAQTEGESELLSEGGEAVAETAAVETETEVKTGSADKEAETQAETVVEAADESAAGQTGGAEAVTEETAESGMEAVTEAVTEAGTEALDPAMAAARIVAEDKAKAFLANAQSSKKEFKELAEEAAKDTSAATSTYTFGEDDTYPDKAIQDATKGLEDGSLVDKVVQVGNSFYVLYVEDAFDEEATAGKKEEIVNQRKDDAISKVYDDWTAKEGANFTVDEKAWTSMVFDMALHYETEAATEALSEAMSEGISEGMSEGEGVAEQVTE